MSNQNNRENLIEAKPVNSVEFSTNTQNSTIGKDDSLSQFGERSESPTSTQMNIEERDTNTGIVIKNVESESLNNLLAYESDSSSSFEMMKDNLNWQLQSKTKDLSDLSSSSSSTLSDCCEDDDDDGNDSSDEDENSYENVDLTDSDVLHDGGAVKKGRAFTMTDADSLEQLPPVPDLSKLSLNVENENFVHMGNIFGIINKVVTIAALPNTPAYDLDTLLFLDCGKKPLGFVFDVLGQVNSPIYAVRFNSVEDIAKLNIQIGTKVYSAPTSEHTQYVFLQQLLKMKGSDASWLGDTEVPPEFADYSDDEKESHYLYGNKKFSPHTKRTHSSSNYKQFENTMNQRNILNTKFNKYMDSYKHTRFNKAKTKRNNASHINYTVPVFDPSVPPPNIAQYPAFYPQSAGSAGLSVPAEFAYHYGIQNGNNNNNAHLSHSPHNPSFFFNNFVGNPEKTNFVNYHMDNNHPGSSQE